MQRGGGERILVTAVMGLSRLFKFSPLILTLNVREKLHMLQEMGKYAFFLDNQEV